MNFYGKTQRVENLLTMLKERAFSDRSEEWFLQTDLENMVGTDKTENQGKAVIIRKALAINEMLKKMTDENISKRTRTYEILPGERIVGVMPMGSNGLGKVFPNYLTDMEKRAASYTNKTELAVLGHNTVDYNRLLDNGLDGIIEETLGYLGNLEQVMITKNLINSEDAVSNLNSNPKYAIDGVEELDKSELVTKHEFYEAVYISCKAVLDYAERFANLAEKMGKEEKDEKRAAELFEIARICRKVPAKHPDTFQEAVQSIYFFHLSLHASLNYISLGRLDQVLIQYLDKKYIDNPETDEAKAYFADCEEILECFIIKAASRLNLTTEYLLKQDHMDNNAALGVHPYYLDQRAGVNNFLQNIIVGGLTPEGKPAENMATMLILNAFANVNLSTPGIYVRMGKKNSNELKQAVAKCLEQTTNLPGILNDDVLIPAFYNSLTRNVEDKNELEEFKSLCNDYCVDGCWELLLNGKCDWTFGMMSCLEVFQCAINRGAVLDPNFGMLRGAKVSFISDQVSDYEEFKDSFQKYMKFFVDQSTFTLYECYMMDEFVTPSPLLSSVLGDCLKNGRDKAWGGVGYNIGGTILTGVPDTINNIAAIKKFVFEEKKYTFDEVKSAMVCNFKNPLQSEVLIQRKWTQMKNDFDNNCNKFGDGSDEIREIGTFVMNTFCDCVDDSKIFTDKVFLKSIKGKSPEYKNEVRRLRKIAGYNGSCFQKRFGKDFNIRFTAGCGTFEGYPQQGLGVVATANRNSNDPIIANFSPAPGTVTKGTGFIFETLKGLPMNRMSAGAITDLCITEQKCNESDITDLLDLFIKDEGAMLTLSFGDIKTYQTIYGLSYDSFYGDKLARESAHKELQKYKDIVVRVGGWQAPFISMSLAQQENYILRFINQ